MCIHIQPTVKIDDTNRRHCLIATTVWGCLRRQANVDPNAVRDGYKAVLKAVESEEQSMNRVDESLARIAALKSKLSLPLAFDTARIAQLSDDVAALNNRLSR